MKPQIAQGKFCKHFTAMCSNLIKTSIKYLHHFGIFPLLCQKHSGSQSVLELHRWNDYVHSPWQTRANNILSLQTPTSSGVVSTRMLHLSVALWCCTSVVICAMCQPMLYYTSPLELEA